MRCFDVAVIGGGPGGLSTSMYSGMRGMSVVVFEAQSFGGQLVNMYPSKPVTNFPAQMDITSRDLALRLVKQAAGFGAELREREAVEHVAPAQKGFLLRSAGADVSARILVLALGLGRFSPRRLGLAREDQFVGRGLVYRLPPIEEIKARRIVVVGGGTPLWTPRSLSGRSGT
jgi:thioredoxin reductase (NADPH)